MINEIEAARATKIIKRLDGWKGKPRPHWCPSRKEKVNEDILALPYALGMPNDNGDIRDLVLIYLLKALANGYIPDADIAWGTLTGKRKVPNCGVIGCDLDIGDHVH
jgi:hypothetical protein